MEINPILRRESRVLWRGDRPFILLLLYALALSVLIAFLYESNRIGEASFNTRIAIDGAGLFRALSYLGLGTWLLVVPITAAPMLALERERGLLEALQLSGIPPWRIVAGKFATVLSFSLLLWMAGAPPLAICFYLGGVSPQEWTSVLGLQMATIITGAALGLFVSSRARRVQMALRDTIFLVAAWIVLSHFSEYIAAAFLDSVRWLFSGWTTPNLVMSNVSYLEYADPFSVLQAVFLDASPATPRPFMAAPVLAADILPIHFRLQVAATLIFLWRATVNAGRALPEAQWVERKRYLTLRKGRIKSTPATPQNGNQSKEQSVFDVPLVTLLRFGNPVLQREVRGFFRMRRFSLPIKVMLTLMIVAAIIGYVMALLFAWAEPNSRRSVWQSLTLVLFYGVVIAAPLRGANAIARERENGTWESLRLSQLEPHTILRGKALAPLMFLFCLCLIAAPVWLPCINWMGAGDDVSLSFALAAAALTFATAFSFTSWGLWISWRCRSAAAATGWTFGTIIFGIAFIISNLGPLLVEWFAYWVGWLYVALNDLMFGVTIRNPFYNNYYGHYGYSSSGPFYWGYSFLLEVFQFLNPLREMSQLIFEIRYSGSYREGYGWLGQPAHAFVAAVVHVLIGCLILLDISRRMKKARFVEEETAERRARKAKTPA